MSTDALDITTDELSEFLELTAKRDELKAQLAALEEERQRVEARLIERFSLGGLQNIKVNGSTVYLNVDTYVNVKPECRDAAMAAAKSLELEDLIAIQPQRFAAWCREQIRDEATGNKLPDEFRDLVNVYERPSLRIRRN